MSSRDHACSSWYTAAASVIRDLGDGNRSFSSGRPTMFVSPVQLTSENPAMNAYESFVFTSVYGNTWICSAPTRSCTRCIA